LKEEPVLVITDGISLLLQLGSQLNGFQSLSDCFLLCIQKQAQIAYSLSEAAESDGPISDGGSDKGFALSLF